MFAIDVINIKIKEVTIFNIKDEKIIVLLFICKIINVTMCVNELNNIVSWKTFNVNNLTIIAYFVIYLISFA